MRLRRVIADQGWLLPVALALVLDVIFYTGFYASDDVYYLAAARKIARGEAIATGVGNDLAFLRLAITAPAALVYWLAGGKIAAVAWFHILYHPGLVILAHALGRLLGDRRTALIAALLAAASPLYYGFAGAVLPDNPAAFWLGAAMLLLELARRRAPPGEALPLQSALGWYVSVGFAIGMSYSCKETGIIMTVPVAFCIVAAAPRLRSTVWVRDGLLVAAGLGAFMLIELIVIHAWTGDWLSRFALVQGTGGAFEQRMTWQGVTPWERFGFALIQRLGHWIPLSMCLVLAAAIAYPFVSWGGRRRSTLLVAFFWWPFLYLTGGTTSFTTYRPPSLQTRYYAIAILPAVLMGAIAVSAMWERWVSRRRPPGAPLPWPAAAIAGGLTLVCLAELVLNIPKAGNLYGARRARAFAAAFEKARLDHPGYPIVLSPFYRRRMGPLYYPGSLEDITWRRGRGKAALPAPPFVMLQTVEELGEKSAGKAGTADVVPPPARRIDAISGALRAASGFPPQSQIDAASNDAAVQVIEAPRP